MRKCGGPYPIRGERRLQVRMGVLGRVWGGESRQDRGANLVEFALIAPLLIILVLGIVEFGWKFGQFNDVRHGVREGARFAAVNAGDEAAILNHVCSSMDGVSAGMTEIRVILTDASPDDLGEVASIRVEADVSTLTNAPIISAFLPSTLASDVQFRLERNSDSWDSTPAPPNSGVLTCP